MKTTNLQRVAMACGAVWLGFAAGEVSAAIPASERAALIALYNSTNGAGWTYRTNWRDADGTDFSPPGTECTWYGVSCDAPASHVTQLILSGNGLDGSIPPEIGNLTKVQDLILDASQLSGSIPSEIGNLTNLQGLLLDRNQLSGPIPPEIGRLASLLYLCLETNQLSGSIPAEIGNLADLQQLYLSDNQLSGSIPPQIGSLTSLVYLYAENNGLSGPIPSAIGNLRNLFHFVLANNQLSGSIPSQIGDLDSLYYLNLEKNQLSGSIPPEIGNLPSLGILVLSNNQLTGIPPQISSVSGLWSLYLSSNLLSGSIPIEITHLRNLQQLDLSSNQLSGPIPPEIGNLTYLTFLDLSSNQLSGLIPTQIGSLSGLLYGLRLSNNELSGPIPTGIGNLASLSHLDLDRNQLSGSIPPQIGNLTYLQELQLGGNQLSGPVPATLANLTLLSPGGSDLRWNALHTNDAVLRAFLNSRQVGGDWESTQTVAPSGLATGVSSPDSVPLSWMPIPYTGDTGGYRIWYGTHAGGPYNLAGTTADKTISIFVVSGLSPATSYYFALDTVTNPHANNQNAVTSERTATVSAMTMTGGLSWVSLSATRYGPGTVSSSPGGIACGGVCAAAYAPGTPLTLTATPDSDSVFLGWGGACSGLSPTCNLAMDSAQAVTASFSPPAVSFYTMTPCRVFDSRDPGLGGPSPLVAGMDTGVMVTGYCGIPATAKAVSLNVTVVSPTAGGHLRLYASGAARPGTSSINYTANQTRANNAVVSLGADGALMVYVSQPSGTTHIVIDVNGYFQ